LTASGTATLAVSGVSSGTHTYSASYDGDASFAASTSTAVNHTVNSLSGSTVTTLTSSRNPALSGVPVTFTASVRTFGGAGTPTGSIQFFDGATAPRHTSGGAGRTRRIRVVDDKRSESRQPPDRRDLLGRFRVRGQHVPRAPQTIYQGPPPALVQVTVTATPVVSASGQPVTITAVLRAAGTSSPTGFVQIVSDGIVIGTVPVAGNGGSAIATLTVSNLTIGWHVITPRTSETRDSRERRPLLPFISCGSCVRGEG